MTNFSDNKSDEIELQSANDFWCFMQVMDLHNVQPEIFVKSKYNVPQPATASMPIYTHTQGKLAENCCLIFNTNNLIFLFLNREPNILFPNISTTNLLSSSSQLSTTNGTKYTSKCFFKFRLTLSK